MTNDRILYHPGAAALAALLAVTCAVYGGGRLAASFIPTQNIAAVATYPNAPTLDPDLIQGVSAVLYDPTTKRILFAKDADTPRALASITKLMTAMAVLERVPSNATVTVMPQDLVPEGDWGLRPGDTLPVYDLLAQGLISSSNDAITAAAASLGRATYLDQMNDMAASLGLSSMRFFNPTGLDLSAQNAGGYGSARDVAILAALFYQRYPHFFEQTTRAESAIVAGDRLLEARATAQALGSLPGFIGAKTGYTDLAGGNLVAVFDLEPGHPVIAVVLGSTEEDRFRDIKTLITSLYDHF